MTELAGKIEAATVVHFISRDRDGTGNITACGLDQSHPMRGNGWRVRDISCPDCDRVICDVAHAALRAGDTDAK